MKTILHIYKNERRAIIEAANFASDDLSYKYKKTSCEVIADDERHIFRSLSSALNGINRLLLDEATIDEGDMPPEILMRIRS